MKSARDYLGMGVRWVSNLILDDRVGAKIYSSPLKLVSTALHSREQWYEEEEADARQQEHMSKKAGTNQHQQKLNVQA